MWVATNGIFTNNLYVLMLRLVIPPQSTCANQYAFMQGSSAPSSINYENAIFGSKSNL
jgi:hypothetical protein